LTPGAAEACGAAASVSTIATRSRGMRRCISGGYACGGDAKPVGRTFHTFVTVAFVSHTLQFKGYGWVCGYRCKEGECDDYRRQ
jgi:hypothetical protein